jgi:hypothetical protein
VFNRAPDWPVFYFHEDLAGDEVVLEALKWLLARAESDGRDGVVVAPTRKHFADHQVLGLAQRTFRCETAATLHKGGTVDGPILAVWPRDEVLAEIERWHRPSALCVVPWNLALIEKWRRARQPIDLLGQAEPAPKPTITDPVVAVAMESVSRFINTNNELAQQEDKAAAVDALQKLHRAGYPIDPVELEVWALADGWGGRGAARLREFAEKIREGRSLRIQGFSWKSDAADLWRQEAERRESEHTPSSD